MSNPLEIFIPVTPYIINQPFGASPAYYAKMGLNGHNGVDLNASHGEPVYCPFNGIAAYKSDAHGGDGIYLQTLDKRDYGTSQNKFMCVLWHLCSKDDPTFPIQIKTDGSWVNVNVGQLLGYADNTGAPYESSGDHLHLGLYPLDDVGQFLEPNNGFRGAVDPSPYFSKLSAQQYISLSNQIKLVGQKIANIFGFLSRA